MIMQCLEHSFDVGEVLVDSTASNNDVIEVYGDSLTFGNYLVHYLLDLCWCRSEAK